MKTKILNIRISLGLTALVLALLACDSNKKVTQAETGQVMENVQDSLLFSGVDVSLVQLEHEIKVNDKSYSQAYLIRLKISNMPKYSGSGVDFYIGNYKIPEYGGTEDGIYFKVFEKEVLQGMNSEKIRYKYGTSQDIWPSKQKLELPDLDALKLLNEKEQIRRKI
jgi:hypothetical protein